MVRKLIRKYLNTFGYEIVKLESHVAHSRRHSWMQELDIKTIIDVGSNEGQFIGNINKILPGRKIYAFEPIKDCYDTLLANTQKLDVVAHNCAIGEVNEDAEINVSSNLVSSSILEMEDLHTTMYPNSEYVKKEAIVIKRLDDVMKAYDTEENVLIKVDVQGYEEQVLKGGVETFKKATAIIIETSIEPLYENQWVFDDVYSYFIDKGFIFLGFADQIYLKTNGIPLYADCIFVKKEMAGHLYSGKQ